MLRTSFYQMPKRAIPTMVPRAGTVAVRRSARLVAAAATENPDHSSVGDSTSQKTPEVQSGAIRRSKIARTTKPQVKKSRENAAEKEDESCKIQCTTKNVKVESISEAKDFRAKEVKTLRRTKSLKKFPSRDLEMKLWELGFRNVAGVDEAGRGPLAGPVVAAACIIPASATIPGKICFCVSQWSCRASGPCQEEPYVRLNGVAQWKETFTVHHLWMSRELWCSWFRVAGQVCRL